MKAVLIILVILMLIGLGVVVLGMVIGGKKLKQLVSTKRLPRN